MVSKLLVFVLGAPGAGKGTQSELILKAEEFAGWSHISAGDLLRAQVQAGTEVGKQAAEYLKEGLMVPSSMIIGLLEEALKYGSHTKVLIDGFPRVLDQLHEFEKQVGPCSKALFFNVPEEVARQRLLQRGENSGRVDDNEETIRTRFKVFESESMPVIEALREQGKVAEIDASASPEEVFAATKLVIQQLEQHYQQQQEHTAAAADGETAAAATTAAKEEPLPAVEPTQAPAESTTAEQAAPQEGSAVYDLAAAEALTLAAAAEPAAEDSDVAAAAPAPAAAAEASELAAAAEAPTASTAEQPPSEGSGVEPAAETSASEAVAAAGPQASAAEQAPAAVEAPASEQEGVPVESVESTAARQAPGLPAPSGTPTAEVGIPAAAAMAAAAAEMAAPAEMAAAASSAAAEPAAAGVMDLQMSGIRTPIVICGPSGVGKGTLINKLMQQYPDRFGFSVSHTTRAPRPGEQHGVHYYFTDPSAMKPQIEAGMFLEHAEVHGNMYGTSLAAVARVSSEGRHCVLDIDVQGAQLVKASALGSRCFFIFVAPPSHDELERRLRNRGTETEEKVLQRLANAEAEIAKAEEPGLFDHVLVNGDLEVAYYQLQLAINQRVPGLLPEVLAQPPPQPAAVHDSAVTSAPVEAAAAPVSSLDVAAPVAAAIAAGTTAATVAAAAPTAEPIANGTAQHAATPAAATAGGTSTLLDFGFGASAGPAVAVKGMPVRQYMDVTVIPVLREGLKALNSARPDDPWQFLADYLVAHKPVAH